MATTFRVLDADGHVQDAYGVKYTEALPEEYRPQAPRVLDFDTGGTRLFMEGRLWSRSYRAGRRTAGGELAAHHLARKGMFDPELRLKDMDLEGIDVAVLFGTLIAIGNVGLQDTGLAAALCRAYHDWLAN